jgi:D-alanine-D-alanine ligase
MSKPNIAFVTGGYSSEAQISYKSAITIMNNMDTDVFNVYKIDIRKEGWFYQPINGGKEVAVNKDDFSITDNEQKINFDGVLIGIHGTPGEDGKLQGYFDLLNLPYTSCSTATSAITFNKRYTVAIAALAGIHVATSYHIFKNIPYNVQEMSAALAFPVFVKPNNGGSSLGMSKVHDATHLQAAIDKAFHEDDQVLIEEFIAGREFTIGVYKANNTVQTLPITEVVAKTDFFDFEAKYSQGLAEEITPAQLEEANAIKIRETAKKLYIVFNCNGVIRIDFIYNEKLDEPFMLEINTVPGQSAASIIPQQVKAAGINLKDFYTGLVLQCLNK